MLELENELKWKISEHVNTYIGLKYSIDGFQTSIGLKVAGFKVKVPIIFMQKPEAVQDEETQLESFLVVMSVYLGSSYLIRKISLFRESKKVEAWKNNELIQIKNKHEDALLLIKDKAKQN